MSERRSTGRVTPKKALRARVRASLPANVVDISPSGIQIEISNSLKPHVNCDVCISLGDGDVVLRATVRRCQAWNFGKDEKDQRVLLYRAGLQFEDVTPEVLEALTRQVLRTAPEERPQLNASKQSPAAPSGSSNTQPRSNIPSIDVKLDNDHIRKILGLDK